VHPSMISRALEIIRSCFVEGVYVDNHFQFIHDTMVNKKLVFHNGNT